MAVRNACFRLIWTNAFLWLMGRKERSSKNNKMAFFELGKCICHSKKHTHTEQNRSDCAQSLPCGKSKNKSSFSVFSQVKKPLLLLGFVHFILLKFCWFSRFKCHFDRRQIGKTVVRSASAPFSLSSLHRFCLFILL